MKSFEELRKEIFELEKQKVPIKYKPIKKSKKIKYAIKIISFTEARSEVDKVIKAKAAQKLF